MLHERQLSSAGCSTSYASEFYSEIAPRLVRKRRRPNLRCAAQQPSHRASSKPERDVHHTFSQPHRAWSPVAARAVTMSPASPPRDGLRYLPTDLPTNIPDTLPRLEELEDLRTRAFHITHSPSDWVGQTSTQRNEAAPSSPTHITDDDESNCGPFDVNPAHEDSSPEPLPNPLPQQPFPGANRSRFPGARLKPPSIGGPTPQPPTISWRAPLSDPQPYSLPSRGSSLHRHRPSAAGPSVVQLTTAIKAVRHWKDMTRLLNGQGGAGGGRGDVGGGAALPQCSLDPFNAAAFLTHLAQLVASSPPLRPEELLELERMQATVLQVIGANIHEYRARQVANMSWALARLGLPSGAAFLQEHLLPAAYPLMRYEPQHLSNTLWAVAATGVTPEDFWLREALAAAGRGLRRREFTSPQHVATLLWALERLGVVPDQEWLSAYSDCALPLLAKANGQDCSNMLASLALMGLHQTSPETTTALANQIAERLQQLLLTTTTTSTLSEGASQAATSALALTPMLASPRRASAANNLPAMDPAPSTLTHGSSTITSDGGGGGAVSDLSLANSLWALSVMGLQPQTGLWEAVCTALRTRLVDPSRPAPGIAPSVLSLVLWAAGSLRRALPGEVMRAVYGRLRERQMEGMEPRSLVTLVWTLSTAPPEQVRPSAEWVAAAVAVTERCMAQLGPQSVSNLLYGLHQLGVRPPPAWMTALINHFHINLADRASGQSLSNVLWCLAKMGYRLNSEGLTALTGPLTDRLQTWQQQLPQHGASSPPLPAPFNSQELSNLMYALAVMGHQPAPDGELASGLMAATRARLVEARPQELSNMMWSMAVMQIRPSDDWLADFCAAAQSALPSFTTIDLAQTLYGAAKLRLLLHLSSPSTSPISTFAAAALAAAPDLLPSAGGQELCNLSWALVRLGLPVPPDSRLAAAFTARLVTLAGRAGGSGNKARSLLGNGSSGRSRGEPALLAMGMWALGKWRVLPAAGQLSQLERSSFRAMPAMRPHELAALLSGFAGMGHTPPPEWLEEAVHIIVSRSKEFGAQDWTVVLYALSRVPDSALRPQLEEMVARLLPALHGLPLPSVVLLAYSAGCMGPSHTGRCLVARCMSVLASHGAPQPALTSGRPLEPRAGARLRRTAASGRGNGSTGAERQEGLDAAGGQDARPLTVDALTPNELSALLWAAVRVGIRVLPAAFRAQFFSRTQPLLRSLPGSLVASYLWAGGRLRMWPPLRWRHQLVAAAGASLGDMRARELAMCMAGMMLLRVFPDRQLLHRLADCFATHRDEMPDNLRQHAERALHVLKRRQALSVRLNSRRYGGLRRWLSAVRRGNDLAVTADKGMVRRQQRPEGYISRRSAVKQGVERRPARLLPAVDLSETDQHK